MQDIHVLLDRLTGMEQLLQAALVLLAHHARLVIYAPPAQLTSMEELLQAVLDLFLIYALLENIRLQAQVLALTVPLDTIALPAQLMHMEELLQAVLVLVV
jgi:hypothetical protein